MQLKKTKKQRLKERECDRETIWRNNDGEH
jgi:hypothetical protein